MKLLRVLLSVSIGLVPVLMGSEDPPPEHVKWMKETGELMGKLRKNVDVEASAKRMAVIFKDVEPFYANRKADVGVKTSKDTVTASMEIASAAGASNAAGIEAGKKNLGAACKGCHDVHREKISDTVYKLK